MNKRGTFQRGILNPHLLTSTCFQCNLTYNSRKIAFCFSSRYVSSSSPSWILANYCCYLDPTMTRMATIISCNLCLNSYFQNVGVNNDVMHRNQMKCETSVHLHSSKCAHSDLAHYSSKYHLMVVKNTHASTLWFQYGVTKWQPWQRFSAIHIPANSRQYSELSDVF